MVPGGAHVFDAAGAARQHEVELDRDLVAVAVAHRRQRRPQLLELAVFLHVIVVAVADAVEADRHPPQSRGVQFVDAAPHQRAVGGHVGIHAEFRRVLDHRGQVAMQQRFAPVEARRGDAGGGSVVEAVAHGLQVEVFADHEVAAVAAALAPEVAGRCDGDGDLAGPRPDQRRNALGEVMAQSPHA